jgi:hypothetical protein
VPRATPSLSSLLDEVMPRYDVHERHEIWSSAPPDDAYAAMKTVTPGEIRLLGPMMRLRMLPGRFRGRRLGGDPDSPVIQAFLNAGFVELGERPGSEIVVGGIGCFWSVSQNIPLRTIRDGNDFIRFAEPGFAKAAMNFVVTPEADGTRIVTETRVVGTSRDASRKFRRYWFAIRLGSGAIRRSWLAAIERRLSRTDRLTGRPPA